MVVGRDTDGSSARFEDGVGPNGLAVDLVGRDRDLERNDRGEAHYNTTVDGRRLYSAYDEQDNFIGFEDSEGNVYDDDA